MGGGPKPVAPPPPPAPPRQDDATAAANMQAAADAENKAKGRASTYLTAGQGILGNSSISKRSLLGS
jgi:hypothetical protein